MAGKSHTNSGAFALEIIGSLIYLFVVYEVAATGYGVGSPLLSGNGSFWLPVFYSTALVGAILLFLASFANLSASDPVLRKAAFLPAVVTAVSLVALTATSNYVWAVIVGFVLSVVGVAVSAGKSW